jgi:hypothetical protein
LAAPSDWRCTQTRKDPEVTDSPGRPDLAPANDLTEFDLATQDDKTAGRGVALDSGFIRWNAGALVRSFDAIEAVELESMMGEDISTAQCDIVWQDGARLSVRIDTGLERDVMTFRGFVLALIERLGPEHRARISFRPLHPPGPTGRIVFISIYMLALIAFAATALWALLSAEAQFEWAAIPLCLLMAGMLALIVRAAFITNDKPFDPMSLPSRALPQEPLKLKLARLRQERQA